MLSKFYKYWPMAITMMRDMTMSGLEKGKRCETEKDKDKEQRGFHIILALLCFCIL